MKFQSLGGQPNVGTIDASQCFYTSFYELGLGLQKVMGLSSKMIIGELIVLINFVIHRDMVYALEIEY